jgi:hypothetical protein
MAKYLCIKKALDYWNVLYGTANFWLTGGNSATNPSVNFIGTTDNVDFRFKRNSFDAGHITANSTALGQGSGNWAQEGGVGATQSSNTSIGLYAGWNSIGSENTFLGTQAGRQNTEQQVVCIGQAAGFQNSGLNLVAVGYNSGNNNSGVNTISLGASSGQHNTGDNIVSLGFRSAEDNTGDKVIALGENAGKNNTQSNRFIIGQDYLPTFAGSAAANAGLPASSANGVYLYIDSTDNTIKARI